MRKELIGKLDYLEPEIMVIASHSMMVVLM